MTLRYNGFLGGLSKKKQKHPTLNLNYVTIFQVIGMSTDSHFSHLAWIDTDRKDGGLGGLEYPLASDFTKKISAEYGVLIEEAGIALRGLFIIDPNVSWFTRWRIFQKFGPTLTN